MFMASLPSLLFQSLAVSPAMYSSIASSPGSASLEHVPSCFGDPQLLTSKAGLNRGFLVPGYDLPLADRRARRKLSVGVVAQNQHSRSRRAGQVPVAEQHKAMLVANHSGAGTKSQTSAVASPPPFPPPRPQIGSPLVWIGVGVGISILFSWAARRVQSYAMQQALKSMMQQSGQGGNPFAAGLGNSPFGKGANPFAGMPPGSFPFPNSPAPSSAAASTATVDVTATPVMPSPSEVQHTAEKTTEFKKAAFTDVTADLLAEEEPITLKGNSNVKHEQPQATMGNTAPKGTGVVDGAASFTDPRSYGGQASTSESEKGQSFVSMDMLERMLDDPKIQQMVFPYLPEEMRDPVTFKRMIQLPPVRQQLQEALNNMGGEDGLDMLKYMNSDVVKEQFEQIGLTPEEVVGKILANPDIAASLQNSKVVEAIMDCSQNPLNITKYQNDKEVMNALLKIAELFPGATGSA